MHIEQPDRELAALLSEFESRGGVVDFVFLCSDSTTDAGSIHRKAALLGMEEIDRRLTQRRAQFVSDECPEFRLKWNPGLMSGTRISFSEFWGTDDVEPKRISSKAWSIPEVDGYKTAFFHPPYALRGGIWAAAPLFERINEHLFGNERECAEILSWSTYWSTYFDFGHEWWGAFYWTIRMPGNSRVLVIGASSSD